MQRKIVLLGIGNILLRDEGFGVRVIEQMTLSYQIAGDINVLDGGSLGIELLPFIMDSEKLLIIDAIKGDQEPGGIYTFKNEEVKKYFKEKVSAHEIGIQDVLNMLEILDKPIKEVVVVGVEPFSLEVGLELTPLIQSKVEKVIDIIKKTLQSWDVEVSKK